MLQSTQVEQMVYETGAPAGAAEIVRSHQTQTTVKVCAAMFLCPSMRQRGHQGFRNRHAVVAQGIRMTRVNDVDASCITTDQTPDRIASRDALPDLWLRRFPCGASYDHGGQEAGRGVGWRLRVEAVKRSSVMIEPIDAVVTSYERGRLTRRQLLQALAVIAVPAATGGQTTAGGVMKGRNLHHVNVQVSDIGRSEGFYRKLFGFPQTRRVQGPDNHVFDLPGGGLIILQKSDTPGRIDHFCVGVDDFDANRLRGAVQAAGIEGVQGSAGDNFFVRDPDGLRVQVSAVDWRG